ncbi:hypothetical protein R1sor_010023 [Riccia sorocarpa]|uniref:Reverse transcriptase domain-containing protein n=1 Tax=Riccia sorocarpa TaxID=122646 RepID=A0ABD3HZI3_9MARC
MGDWNAVCNQNDASSKSLLQGEDEKGEFNALCGNIGVKDAREVATKIEGPRFTRAQKRNGSFTWSRIDRIYTAQPVVGKVKHHVTFSTSDHIPVSAETMLGVRPQLGGARQKSPYFKVDPKVVQDNLETINKMWVCWDEENRDEGSMERFALCWSMLRGQLKKIQYERVSQLQRLPEKENKLQALADQDIHSMSKDDQNLLGELMSEVRELQAWKQHRWKLTCRERFLKNGEACTGYFFQRFKKRRARMEIKTLEVEGGVVLDTPQLIGPAILRSFQDLYGVPEEGVHERDAREEFITGLPYRLAQEQKMFLDERPSELEIFETVCLLKSDQEKAYDRLLPNYLWGVMRKIGFSEEFVGRIRALQQGAETRITFNGGLLPAFIVGRGVRQGCPLSPLLFALTTVPMINRFKVENSHGRVKPLKLKGGFALSIICLADDVALYMELDEGSVVNTFRILERMQVASAAKVNWIKSQALIMGRDTIRPQWLSDTGIQVAESTEPTRYLGAQLVTKRRGAQVDQVLLTKLTRKAQALSSPLLTFEARVTALKHAVAAILLYPMLSGTFKKGTYRQMDQILRKYTWTANDEGKSRMALTAWDSITVPMKWGGLRIFAVQLFHKALLCRTVARAIESLETSLWAPVFATCFIQVSPDRLDIAPGTAGLPRDFKAKWESITETMETARLIINVCAQNGVAPEELICQNAGGPDDWRRMLQGDREWRVVRFLITSPRGIDEESFDPGEWRGEKGEILSLGWTGSKIYKKMLGDRQMEDTSHALSTRPRWRDLWTQMAGTFQGWHEVGDMIGGLETPPGIIIWALEATKDDTLFRIWLLAITWRTLWAEMCSFLYERNLKKVNLVRLVFIFLEELHARRRELDKDMVSKFAAKLLAVSTVKPKRYMQLLDIPEETRKEGTGSNQVTVVGCSPTHQRSVVV